MSGRADGANVLILGGSGFLSGTVAARAIGQGHRVWTLTRGQRPLPAGVTGLVADRHDAAAFTRAVAGAGTAWDLVIDCIAFGPDDIRQDIAVFRSLARHLVFVSTDFVYDPAGRRFPQGEESDRYLTNGYGGGKRAGELALLDGDLGHRLGAPAWTIVRPGHIYGPGSRLGCLPLHSRDPQLLDRLRAGEPLRLVGGGHFLQQPVLARDLADLLLSFHGNPRTYGQVFCVAGPEIVESREYYRIVADLLDVGLTIEEVPVGDHLAAHPEATPFLCHRIYDLAKLRASGAAVPRTPLVTGLGEQIASLLDA